MDTEESGHVAAQMFEQLVFDTYPSSKLKFLRPNFSYYRSQWILRKGLKSQTALSVSDTEAAYPIYSLSQSFLFLFFSKIL